MSIGRYKRINKNIREFSSQVQTSIPSPTEKDYKRGYIKRYFIQRANDSNSTIYEVSKDFFSSISSNSLFLNTSLDWRIVGEDSDVKKSNSESIRIASHRMKKLKLYLPNLLQFKKR